MKCAKSFAELEPHHTLETNIPIVPVTTTSLAVFGEILYDFFYKVKKCSTGCFLRQRYFKR
jgi:hypothetical protein